MLYYSWEEEGLGSSINQYLHESKEKKNGPQDSPNTPKAVFYFPVKQNRNLEKSFYKFTPMSFSVCWRGWMRECLLSCVNGWGWSSSATGFQSSFSSVFTIHPSVPVHALSARMLQISVFFIFFWLSQHHLYCQKRQVLTSKTFLLVCIVGFHISESGKNDLNQ